MTHFLREIKSQLRSNFWIDVHTSNTVSSNKSNWIIVYIARNNDNRSWFYIFCKLYNFFI